MNATTWLRMAALAAGVFVGTQCTTASSAPGDGGVPPDAQADATPPPAFTTANYPHMDGSTSTIPLDRLIACEILGLPYRWQAGLGAEGEAEIVPVANTAAQQVLASWIMEHIHHSRTHDAFVNLIDGTADLIMVANKPSPDEQAYADSKGVTLEVRAVALDALIILVNASNGITGLTTAQIRKIFMGQLTDWKQVGAASGDIHPYVRPENSGSQQLMNTVVMGGLHMPDWPDDRRPGLMGQLIDAVASDPLAIGYSVYYYVTFQRPGTGYGVLTVDGVKPTSTTIRSGAYPFDAEVWLVTRADLDPHSTAAELRDWLLTPSGQAAVARSGYVALRQSEE